MPLLFPRWKCGVIPACIPQALLDLLLRVSGPALRFGAEMMTRTIEQKPSADSTAIQPWGVPLTLPLSGRQGALDGELRVVGGLSTRGAC